MAEPTNDDPKQLLDEAIHASRSGPMARCRGLFRAAHEAFLSRGEVREATRALLEEARALASSLAGREILEVHRILEEAAKVLAGRPDPELDAQLLHIRGYAYLRANDPVRAAPALLESSRRFHEIGDARGEARVLDTLGVLWDRRGDHEKAALLVARALALKQRAGDREGTAISLGNLGRIALHGEQIDEAESFLAVDLDLARELDDRRGEAMVRINLSECHLVRNRLADAESEALTARSLSRDMGDRVAEGFALVALANARRALGHRPDAEDLALEAEERFREAALPAGVAHARLARARVLAAEGKPDLAARAALGSARAARAGAAADLEIEALLEAYRALSAAGDPRRSAWALRRAQDRALKTGLDGHLSRVQREQRALAACEVHGGRPVHVLLELVSRHLAGFQGRTTVLLVEGLLGQGTFGTVLRVRQSETGEVFALKRLNAGYERRADVAARLKREFTAVERVSHPSVARPHAFGWEEGRPCLLLDYVETAGRYRSLQDLLDDLGKLPIELAARLAARVGRGLEALHASGVVHRDVKPANVLLHRDGHAVLTDYGIAYDLHEHAYVPSDEFKGTLAYAAPEACTFAPDLPTPAVDLYALGVILYQALTGAWPHPYDKPGLSYFDLVRMKSTQPLSVRELRPEISEELASLVSSLLETDPQRRESSAGAVAAALERMAEGCS